MLRTMLLVLPPLMLMSAFVYLEREDRAGTKPKKSKNAHHARPRAA